MLPHSYPSEFRSPIAKLATNGPPLQIVISYQLSTFFQGFIGMYTVSFEPTFWRSMAIAWVRLAVIFLHPSVISASSPTRR